MEFVENIKTLDKLNEKIVDIENWENKCTQTHPARHQKWIKLDFVINLSEKDFSMLKEMYNNKEL